VINPGYIGTFIAIAVNTGEGQIVDAVGAAVLFRDYVIYLKRGGMK
jgi:hypothetical protein